MQREREYDLFERLPDGSPIWRGRVVGLQEAQIRLQQLASTTPNECFALYLPTKEIVHRLNGSPTAHQETNAAPAEFLREPFR
jgi:hypothetical protein